MTKPKKTVHDKQLEVWSNAVKVAVEYIQCHANRGDDEAKHTLMSIMAILYENESEE